MRRRLLQRLQQRIERMPRQHVHFVDQIDLVAAACRHVLHVVEQLARVVDLGARRRVHLDQIDEAPLVDLATGRALAARRRRDALLTVEALGQNPRDRRLADATRAGEQERVVHAIVVERIRQRAQHVLLADHLGEVARPPGTSESGVTHGVGGSPHQPNFGTRHRRCRCSLPGLTGFTVGRREGTDTDCHRSSERSFMKLAERVGFEPTNTLRCYLTSNQAPSTARPSLRINRNKNNTLSDYSRNAL